MTCWRQGRASCSIVFYCQWTNVIVLGDSPGITCGPTCAYSAWYIMLRTLHGLIGARNKCRPTINWDTITIFFKLTWHKDTLWIFFPLWGYCVAQKEGLKLERTVRTNLLWATFAYGSCWKMRIGQDWNRNTTSRLLHCSIRWTENARYFEGVCLLSQWMMYLLYLARITTILVFWINPSEEAIIIVEHDAVGIMSKV